MAPPFLDSPTSISLTGLALPGALERQQAVPGFDQGVYSDSRILCIGAGGIVSHIAPTLVRKGIGRITFLDRDRVEPSNLSRQRFYLKDIGEYKALALSRNLLFECTANTKIEGCAWRFEEATLAGIDLDCDVAICGVDNNPARVAASRYFRARNIPVVFAAVSIDTDHGYVFVQDRTGPCIGCLFPDLVDDDRHPCPGTPSIADILQAVGSLAVYAVDSLLMNRERLWNYRRLSLADASLDGASMIGERMGCMICQSVPGPDACNKPELISANEVRR